MSAVQIQGNASGTGTVTVAAPNTNSNRNILLPDATTTLVGTDATQTLTNKTIQGGAITAGTAVASTSGTSIDFTNIPSWVKRITVMFSGVSTNGTSAITVRLGISSGVETTGYAGTTLGVGPGGSVAPTGLSSGFQICDPAVATAASTWNGQIIISQLNSSANTWAASGNFGRGDSVTTGFSQGAKSLSGTLDRVRITTTGGTDTFDAGSINILYEG